MCFVAPECEVKKEAWPWSHIVDGWNYIAGLVSKNKNMNPARKYQEPGL